MSKRKPYVPPKPKHVEGQFAVRTEFYRDYLHRLTKGIFKLECPDYCDRDYVLNTIMDFGYIIITDTPAGILPLRGSIYGYNYQNIQTKARIVVPNLPEFTRKLGKDAEIIYLERKPTRVFYTFHEMIGIYAEKLASLDAGIEVNNLNAKLAYLAEAESKAQADTIKNMFERITEGEPLVVYRKDALTSNPMQVAFNNLRQNYIVPDMQDAKRTVINEYLTMLGVNNANTDKKERLLTSEVDANNQELKCNTEVWRENLDTCMKKVSKMFPDFNFKLNIQFKGEVENHDISGNSKALEYTK